MTRLDERWPPPTAIAHRGSRLLWPENTMEAFSRAVGLGYRYLETDLRVTSDEVVVCFHDPTVDRTTEGTGPVAALDLDALTRLDAGYRHVGADGHTFRGQGIRVPTLEEVVLSYPDVSLVVDLKAEGVVGPLKDMIDRLDLRDRLIVGSFSDARLAEFRQAAGGAVATSTGSAASRSWVFASRIGRGVRGDASALQLPRRARGLRVITPSLIGAAHARGLQVHVWTVNDPIEMAELLDMGVDALITDRPDVLKEVLASRGQWR
jgi:glycerophosphoryl diester phosphodiesterase